MADLSRHDNPYTSKDIVYGSVRQEDGGAWDHDVIYGCICDSSWPVGFDFHEWQLSQYFGPDCSLSKFLCCDLNLNQRLFRFN